MEDIAKLPKWAQRRINIAESGLKEMERLMDATKVRIDRILSGAPAYLPDDRGIVFSLEKRGYTGED